MQGYPGPSISFNHLYCSMCGTAGREILESDMTIPRCSFDHPLLEKEIQPILELKEVVEKLAVDRLKASIEINDEVCTLQPSTKGRCL